jgi:hypothetical protein
MEQKGKTERKTLRKRGTHKEKKKKGERTRKIQERIEKGRTEKRVESWQEASLVLIS